MAEALAKSDTTRTARVLVAHAYFRALDAKQALKAKPYPPLATLYVAAALREAGHDVAFFDAMLAPDETAFLEPLATAAPDVVVLYEDNFNFLTKMCTTRNRDATLEMIRMAKAVGARPILVRTGNGADTEGRLPPGSDVEVFDDLAAASAALLKDQ